ncbi:hypothetical protein Tco_0633413 [Tanacetum coccineum]
MFVDHMHQPWRTLAAIINKSLSRKTASNDKLRKSRIDILWGMFYRENVDYPELIWEDFAFQIDHRKEKKSRLKTLPFSRFTKVIINHFLKQHKSLSNLKYQHYHTIKDDESYQMFIKYSTGQIPPKMSRGKGSQGKKSVDVSQETVDVSEESEPEPANITEAEEEEATKTCGCYASSQRESKKTSRRQPGTKGSSKETGRRPGVLDESTIVSATSSKGTGTKPGVLDEEKPSSEEKVILKWGSKQESEYSEEDLNEEEEIDWIHFEEDKEKKDDIDDDKSINLEMTDDEETNDEVLQGKEQVNDDEDEEMTNAEIEESRNGDEEDTDVANANAEKTEDAKDDSKKAELPPTSSSLSVSSSFGDLFLKLSYDTFLIGTIKDTTDAKIKSLLDIKTQSEVPHIQSSFVLKVPMFVIIEPSVLTPVQESPSVAPVTTLPPPSVSTLPHVPLQQTTTPIPTPPITTDAPTITTAVPESDALSAV